MVHDNIGENEENSMECNNKSSQGDDLITLNVMREQRELDGVSW